MSAVGDLRHLIRIMRPATEPSGDNDASFTESLVAQTYADIRTLRGTERLESVNSGEGSTHRFRMRYTQKNKGVQRRDVIVVRAASRYEVDDVEFVNEGKRWIECLATELTIDPTVGAMA